METSNVALQHFDFKRGQGAAHALLAAFTQTQGTACERCRAAGILATVYIAYEQAGNKPCVIRL
jgi:hypothetical protein